MKNLPMLRLLSTFVLLTAPMIVTAQEVATDPDPIEHLSETLDEICKHLDDSNWWDMLPIWRNCAELDRLLDAVIDRVVPKVHEW